MLSFPHSPNKTVPTLPSTMSLLQTLADDYGLAFLLDLYDFLVDSARNGRKVVLHTITGQCEIARLCDNKQMHNTDMTVAFSGSIKRSKQLCQVSLKVFGPSLSPFDVHDCCESIVSIKHLPNETSLLVANIRNCLRHMNLLNCMVDQIGALKAQTFSDGIPAHVEMLEELWNNLRPNIRRKGGRITEEWSELGFQGKDPSTDFRGMGMLGLTQLVYFSKHHTALAIQLLYESQVDVSYFPFAATGINVTAFVLELLMETRLHDLVYKEMDHILLNDTASISDPSKLDPSTIQEAMTVVHRIYSLLFLRLGRMWLTSDSVDLMGFPKVFKEFKTDARGLYPKL